MRKLMAAALLSLALVGGTIASVSAAENEFYVPDSSIDASSLSNQNFTMDDAQSNSGGESPADSPAPADG